MEEFISLVTIFGSTGILAAIAKIALQVWDWWSKKKGIMQQDHTLHAVKDTYEALHMVMRSTGAARASVMALHNGGDIPKVGKALYFSILYEICRPDVQPLGEMAERREVDEAYIRMFLTLLDRGSLWIDPEKEPERSVLRDICSVARSKTVFKFVLGRSPEQTVYVSCHFDGDKPSDTPNNRAMLAAAKSIMQKIFVSQGQIFQIEPREPREQKKP